MRAFVLICCVIFLTEQGAFARPKFLKQEFPNSGSEVILDAGLGHFLLKNTDKATGGLDQFASSLCLGADLTVRLALITYQYYGPRSKRYGGSSNFNLLFNVGLSQVSVETTPALQLLNSDRTLIHSFAGLEWKPFFPLRVHLGPSYSQHFTISIDTNGVSSANAPYWPGIQGGADFTIRVSSLYLTLAGAAQYLIPVGSAQFSNYTNYLYKSSIMLGWKNGRLSYRGGVYFLEERFETQSSNQSWSEAGLRIGINISL